MQTTILSSLCDPDSSEDETNIEKNVEEISAKQYQKKPKSKKNAAQKSKKVSFFNTIILRLKINFSSFIKLANID